MAELELEVMQENGITYLTVTRWREEGVLAIFSTRRGGVSTSGYADLNLSFRVGDREEAVVENRRRLGRAVGLPPERWVAANQVHGSRVVWVGSAEAGRGAERAEDAIAACDGLVTDERDLALVELFADCVPVLFRRRHPPAVAVIHAGWRGTVKGIARVATELLCSERGTGVGDLEVVIGPSIGPCCYAVGEEVVVGLRNLLGSEAEEVIFAEQDRWRVDLARANYLVLRRMGLAEEQIFLCSLCTACNPEWFYSHRRDGPYTGRFAGLIAQA